MEATLSSRPDSTQLAIKITEDEISELIGSGSISGVVRDYFFTYHIRIEVAASKSP